MIFLYAKHSAHKRCISAAVEDFLTDHQDDNIDINDLRVLDSIISDSIISRNGEDSGLTESISQGTYLNYDKNKSGIFGDTLQVSQQDRRHLYYSTLLFELPFKFTGLRAIPKIRDNRITVRIIYHEKMLRFNTI